MLAFAASGWSSMVSAALCPRANGSMADTVMPAGLAADHSSCPLAKPAPASKPACHDSSMDDAAMGDMGQAQAAPYASNAGVALGSPEDACTHCMGRQELPASTRIVRQKVETGRNLEAPAVQAVAMPVAPASYARRVLYRQGAPPGPYTPRHILISLLLI